MLPGRDARNAPTARLARAIARVGSLAALVGACASAPSAAPSSTSPPADAATPAATPASVTTPASAADAAPALLPVPPGTKLGEAYGVGGLGPVGGSGTVAAAATGSIRESSVKGGLEWSAVQKVIVGHAAEVKACYDEALGRAPALAGQLAVRLTVGAEGQVVSSAIDRSTLSDPALETCVVERARRWEFPKPTTKEAIVRWPFGLTPGAQPGDGRVDAGARRKSGIDREVIRGVIAAHRAEVKACYDAEQARAPTLAGKVTVQFSIGAEGTIVRAVLQATTLGSPPVEACVVETVRKWEFPPPAGGGVVTVSYPFTFAPDAAPAPSKSGR
jgi:TonB family protein